MNKTKTTGPVFSDPLGQINKHTDDVYHRIDNGDYDKKVVMTDLNKDLNTFFTLCERYWHKRLSTPNTDIIDKVELTEEELQKIKDDPALSSIWDLKVFIGIARKYMAEKYDLLIHSTYKEIPDDFEWKNPMFKQAAK